MYICIYMYIIVYMYTYVYMCIYMAMYMQLGRIWRGSLPPPSGQRSWRGWPLMDCCPNDSGGWVWYVFELNLTNISCIICRRHSWLCCCMCCRRGAILPYRRGPGLYTATLWSQRCLEEDRLCCCLASAARAGSCRLVSRGYGLGRSENGIENKKKKR